MWHTILRKRGGNMKELIETIKQIETKEGKIYWIKALKVGDVIKGRLIIYFNLLGV